MSSRVGSVLDNEARSGPRSRLVAGSTGRARRWLHLPVDVKARELNARILLACIAAERGFGSILGLQGHVGNLADRFPRGVRLEKTAQLKNLPGVETRERLGYVTCCLDEEGLIFTGPTAYTSGRVSRSVLDRMHRFFAWGEDQAEILSSWHPPVTDRLRLTGNSRVDLWRPELRPLYHEDVAALHRRFGSFVLFSTAFAMVNHKHGEQFFAETLHANGGLDTEAKAEVEGYMAHSRRLFEAMKDALGVAARARPGKTIVVRPHPSEDIGAWEEAAAGLANVEVCLEGTVTPWLLAAAAVVHNNSTTGVESVLLDRPTIAFAPYVDEQHDQNLPNRVSRQASSASELVDLLDDIDRPGSWSLPTADRALLAHHISALDGPLATERMMDVMDEIDVPVSPLWGGVGRRIRSQVQLGPIRLTRRLGLHQSIPRYPAPTKRMRAGAEGFPPTPIEEVVSVMDRIGEVTGRFGDVVCHEVSERLFVIEPGDD